MVNATESQLRQNFSERNFELDQITLVKGIELCEINGWSAEDLCDKWESFAIKNSNGALMPQLTPDALDRLARDLLSQQQSGDSRRRSGKGILKTSRKPLVSTQNRVKKEMTDAVAPSNAGGEARFEEDFLMSIGAAPASSQSPGLSSLSGKRNKPFASPATHHGKHLAFSPSSYSPAHNNVLYGSRSNIGKIEFVFNETLAPSLPIPGARTPRCDIKIFPNCQNEAYKYMFENQNEKAEVLDDRIEELTMRMMRKNYIEELVHVGLPYQGDVFVGGRVCCDSEGRLNMKSVMLEGSRETSSGKRVPFNLQSMSSAFSLFPGQIICAEGANTNGNEFTPHRIIQGCPAPFKKTAPAELAKFNQDASHLGGKPMSIVVAAGPFTVPGDITYQPLRDLVKNAVKVNPDVVILMGPFLDSENNEIANIGELYESFFTESICSILEPLIEFTRTQIVMVPSVKDLHHDSVYPQPPFEKCGSSLPTDRVVLAPNPGTIMVNEVTIGFTTQDIIFELGKEEVDRTPRGTPASDRLGRLVSHVIDQRCYYPLYPPALGANVSFSHFAQTEMAVTPDILLVPSRMKYFAKDIKQSLCVNPGGLTKGTTGGTFAQLVVHPLRREDLVEGEKSMTHKVVSRTRVEICRI